MVKCVIFSSVDRTSFGDIPGSRFEALYIFYCSGYRFDSILGLVISTSIDTFNSPWKQKVRIYYFYTPF
jgi:hypothetical protein